MLDTLILLLEFMTPGCCSEPSMVSGNPDGSLQQQQLVELEMQHVASWSAEDEDLPARIEECAQDILAGIG